MRIVMAMGGRIRVLVSWKAMSLNVGWKWYGHCSETVLKHTFTVSIGRWTEMLQRTGRLEVRNVLFVHDTRCLCGRPSYASPHISEQFLCPHSEKWDMFVPYPFINGIFHT